MNQNKILLHICCAPDATVPLKTFAEESRGAVCYFYGGNIQPVEEMERRKFAVEKLVRHMGIECIYDTPCDWMDKTKDLSDEPEGGKRCERCFRLQLEGAARAAKNTGCNELCTTLTISPHKNVRLINEIGNEIAQKNGLNWLERIWRKENGFLRSIKMAKELELFRQNYCGCIYSLSEKINYLSL